MTAEGWRKHVKARVTVYGRGSGKLDINGEDMRFFKLIQDREQVCVCVCVALKYLLHHVFCSFIHYTFCSGLIVYCVSMLV